MLILLYLITGIIRTKTELTDEEPFVSVIVAAHNEAQNIEPFILAIKKAMKNFKDYEIIFVNDGSTDDSETILRKICKEDKKTTAILHIMGTTKASGEI